MEEKKESCFSFLHEYIKKGENLSIPIFFNLTKSYIKKEIPDISENYFLETFNLEHYFNANSFKKDIITDCNKEERKTVFHKLTYLGCSKIKMEELGTPNVINYSLENIFKNTEEKFHSYILLYYSFPSYNEDSVNNAINLNTYYKKKNFLEENISDKLIRFYEMRSIKENNYSIIYKMKYYFSPILNSFYLPLKYAILSSFRFFNVFPIPNENVVENLFLNDFWKIGYQEGIIADKKEDKIKFENFPIDIFNNMFSFDKYVDDFSNTFKKYFLKRYLNFISKAFLTYHVSEMLNCFQEDALRVINNPKRYLIPDEYGIKKENDCFRVSRKIYYEILNLTQIIDYLVFTFFDAMAHKSSNIGGAIIFTKNKYTEEEEKDIFTRLFNFNNKNEELFIPFTALSNELNFFEKVLHSIKKNKLNVKNILNYFMNFNFNKNEYENGNVKSNLIYLEESDIFKNKMMKYFEEYKEECKKIYKDIENKNIISMEEIEEIDRLKLSELLCLNIKNILKSKGIFEDAFYSLLDKLSSLFLPDFLRKDLAKGEDNLDENIIRFNGNFEISNLRRMILRRKNIIAPSKYFLDELNLEEVLFLFPNSNKNPFEFSVYYKKTQTNRFKTVDIKFNSFFKVSEPEVLKQPVKRFMFTLFLRNRNFFNMMK